MLATIRKRFDLTIARLSATKKKDTKSSSYSELQDTPYTKRCVTWAQAQAQAQAHEREIEVF